MDFSRKCGGVFSLFWSGHGVNRFLVVPIDLTFTFYEGGVVRWQEGGAFAFSGVYDRVCTPRCVDAGMDARGSA